MLCTSRWVVKNKWELVNIFWLGQRFWLRFGTYMELTFTLHFIKKFLLLLTLKVMLLGIQKQSLSDVCTHWQHFWLSSYELKISSNLKQYDNGFTVNPLYNDTVCSKLSLTLKWICCYKEILTINRFQHNNHLVKENIVQMN